MSSGESQENPPDLVAPHELLQKMTTLLQTSWPITNRYSRRGVPSLEIGRARIDNEIRQVADALDLLTNTTICTLRSQRNSLASVSLLAQENRSHQQSPLAAIFEIAAEGGRDFRTLLSISHSCSYWRKVCIETEALYRFIDVSVMPVTLAEHFLTRSPTPFILLYRQSVFTGMLELSPNESRALTFCRDKISRAREAHFSFSRIPLWLHSMPAPRLQKFVLNSSARYLPEVNPTILDTLFGDSAPQLRELSMTGSRILWSSKIYRGLRKLSISLEQFTISQPLSSRDGDVLLILENSPFLEELSLQHPPMRKDFPLARNPFDLPRLQSVSLDLVTSDKSISREESSEAGQDREVATRPIQIMFASTGDMLETLSYMRALDLASSLEIVKIIDNNATFAAGDVLQAIKMSSRISELHLEGCATSVLCLLTAQVLYSRVPVGSNLHTLLFHRVTVSQDEVVDLCQSLSGRLRRICFTSCTFHDYDKEEALLASLRGGGIGEVSSSDAFYISNKPKKPAKQPSRNPEPEPKRPPPSPPPPQPPRRSNQPSQSSTSRKKKGNPPQTEERGGKSGRGKGKKKK
ncbi:hypothetical protein NLI96_g1794 [Meripilus lineatus]|uniref:F-box domain-containing protein n=1 Tax=Meripilus lineatus TaxID=2056292 RepID=A0AAD5VC02_9APHY|nr:hypothetical protein NLI96_g1794 [Physisporinus lineatus]